ncbi:extracellular calcium-sensing receptor [Hydra vulgaris]|uniref:extracellular calcium-sensing receptor n=1 Tax=Hydra vulgaris TaxID=6087 RepID=UPI001F5F55E1|nr:extracellular calcium-sensing receptor-like [Hydra vulgaris]
MYWELALEFFFMFVGFALSKLCMETKVESGIKGQFLIPGLFPLRCSSLDDIDMRTVAWIEALKYTVEEENKRQNKSLFDYVIYDTYDSTNFDKTSFAILDTLMFSPNNKIATCACDDFVQQNNILGFLGPSESANCIYALALAMPYTNFPIISYSATSVDLDNRILYPNFFRTVPPDNYQALFIIDILKKFHWTYVAVIAIDSSYGRAGIEQLVKVVENDVSGDRICFAFTAILPQVYNPSKYSTVVKNLIKEIAANVIVVIGTFNLVQNILKETHSQNLTRRTWLLSEATGKNTWFFDYNNHVGNNFLFIVQTEGADDLFQKYFFGLTYQNSSPWLKAVFEKYGVNESTNNFSTNNISQVFDLSMVSFVQDAVKVLIEAFYLYQKTFSTNITQKIYNRTKFNEQIKKVNFHVLNNSKTFSFNSNQNPESAYFELYTLSNSTFVNIALWSNNLSLMFLKNNTELNTIKSTCSTPCLAGERKLVSSVSSLKLCCWTCLLCPDNSVTKSSNDQNCTVCDESIDEYPNEKKDDCIKRKRLYWNLSNSPHLPHQVLTLIFCSIGAILSAIFIFTFVIKKKTPIIRSSNYELSLIQLFFHFIMFILPLLTFPEETSIKCAVRIYLGSLLHVVVITIILVKVTRIVTVFNLVNHRKLSTKKTFYIRSKIILMLVFFPCLFIVLIFVVHKSKYEVFLEDDKRVPLQKYCNAHSFWLFHLCYVLLLSTLCGYQTFKSKSLPWKFNETSKIAYSLFFSNITLCALVGLNYSSLDTNTRKFTSCILMSVSMFFLMIILFFSKIKVVWLNPEKNSLSEFRKSSFKTVYSNESLRSASLNQNDFIPSISFNQDEHLSSAVLNQDESFRSRVNQEESPHFIALNQFTIENMLNIEAC